MIVEIENTDENADWIKWRTDDVQVSEDAKQLLKVEDDYESVPK